MIPMKTSGAAEARGLRFVASYERFLMVSRFDKTLPDPGKEIGARGSQSNSLYLRALILTTRVTR